MPWSILYLCHCFCGWCSPAFPSPQTQLSELWVLFLEQHERWQYRVEKHWWGSDAGSPAHLVPHQRGKGSFLPMSHPPPPIWFTGGNSAFKSKGSNPTCLIKILVSSKPCVCLVQFIRADTCFFSCYIKSPDRFWFFSLQLRSHLVQVFLNYLN